MIDIKKLLTKIMSNGVFKDTNGNISVGGHIYAEGHGTYIGYTNNGNGTKSSMSSGTTPQQIVGSISLTTGTWVVVGSVNYPSNSNGVRYLAWYQGGSALSQARMLTQAVSGGFDTRLSVTAIVSVTGASSTMALYGYQNSSSALNVPFYWSIVRIA